LKKLKSGLGSSAGWAQAWSWGLENPEKKGCPGVKALATADDWLSNGPGKAIREAAKNHLAFKLPQA
jgi:hypothetical protein